jgi:hypothetical protein
VPVTPPNSPHVNTGGASNTKCTVVVYTHDKGPENASTEVDISPYITSVGISQHLSGGGAADITLPAVDFIENLFAAGDMINIYFNTNRGDVDLYNRGNVRVFFGYIENITKTVSVSGTGSKITTYNISCKDFSKAIRATEIYHNPHLSHQTEEKKKGVVRKDVRANLGGIALLNKGIAVEGTPRQIILQNLMRLLGFGGQWALPFSYRESLPKSAITIFDKKEKGKQSFANDLQGAKYAVINSPDETVKKEFIKLLEDLALEAVSVDKPVSQLWKDAIEVPSESATLLHKRVKALANKFRYSNFEFQTPEAAKSGKLAFINNTFFKIQGVSKDKLSKGMGASNPDVIVSEKEQGLKEDLEKVTKRVLKEVQSYDNNVVNEFGAFPRANLFAEGAALSQVEAFKTDVGTIFNILCLDYLEPSGGIGRLRTIFSTKGLFTQA